VKAGDHVAVILANYPEYVAVKYAIARAGAVAVHVVSKPPKKPPEK